MRGEEESSEGSARFGCVSTNAPGEDFLFVYEEVVRTYHVENFI